MNDLSTLRVAFVSDAMQNRNGVGTYYYDLAEHLRDHLDHAELLCPEYSPEVLQSQAYSFSLPGDPTQRVYVPKIRRICKKIKQIAPDILIVPTPGPYGIVGLGLTKWIGARFCAGYHTQYEKLTDLYWNSVMSKISAGYMKYLHKLFFRASSLVVANSSDMLEAARKGGAHDVRLVGTPIAKGFLETPLSPLSSRLKTVLYAGRLAGEKNLAPLLDTAAELSHLHFIIAGDGPLKPLVEERARLCENIEYLGWIPRQGVMKMLDRADMLVLPSKVESFGTIALEAMARRKLVLVSPGCGILRWPSLARGIFRIEEGENLTEAIRRIDRLGAQKKCDAAILAHYSAEAFNNETLEQWFDVFRRIMYRPQSQYA